MKTRVVTIDLGARAYDIYIGRGLLARFNDYLPEGLDGRDVFIVCDKQVSNYAQVICDALSQSGAGQVQLIPISGGESAKSFQNYQHVSELLLSKGIKRDALIVALGGGVIGDLVGFVAASLMRGIDFVQVPTTLLAQVDSSVGGKTGINSRLGKNLIGAFYQPKAVIADLDVLASLPKRELLAGYAEIAKYGLINDAGFFEWLEQNGQAVCQLQDEALARAIEISVEAKARIVQADEREAGQRALLNLGHTFGHALEAAAGYDGRLLHGEAVSIGMVMAFEASMRADFCDEADLARVEQHLSDVGLPTRAAQISPALQTSVDELISLMQKDKKADKDAIKFILTHGIGDSFVTKQLSMDVIRGVIKDSLISDSQGIKEGWKSAF